ncbi:MAG: phosphoribosylglycinamide formyltransferase [Thaumarchaeota archaeon]|nr:phosphoribosylglycinamide formyltransferase [Nitrososphaerota archaeon]
MLNLGILISGRGSNMEAILKSIQKKKIPANPAIVISNRPDARGLDIAQRLGVKTEILESRNFDGNRKEYDEKIAKILVKNKVTQRNGLVCLAGFMRIIGPELVRKYKNRIINIHPSLLPSFPGLDAQRQALEYGARYTGCTIHFVDSGVDSGPIILQKTVEIKKTDTVEVLSRRILAKEHVAYPEAVRLFALKKIKVSGRRITIG